MKKYKIINGVQTYISRRGYAPGVTYSWIHIDDPKDEDGTICLGDPWKSANPPIKEIIQALTDQSRREVKKNV